ncbi:peptidase M23, partial [Leptospira sp. 201903070]|nr:peptidase M23 [Leptospira ainlahdjerensis]
YQGAQTWDAKWQDLLAKQAAWEQNSLNSIQDGILQWNQAITGLENDKLNYLNGIEQTKAQWLANKQLIQDAQNGVRTGLQNTILSIRAQENQLRSSASNDPSLDSVFEDMDSLLDNLQSALDSNSSLGSLAETLGNFFQNQISNATAMADYWNIQKWQETYATQTFDYSKEVGTANLSCSHTSGSGANWCLGQSSGSQAVTYGSDGNVYGWSATSGGFLNGVLVGNPAASNNSSASRSDGHNIAVCNGIEVGGTCNLSSGQYALDTSFCGGGLFCGYDLSWVVDNTYSLSVGESFNQQQIANNNAIRNSIFGNFNVDFGQSSQAGNALGGSTPIALETKVFLGGSALTSSNWYSALGTNNQVQIQTKYKYIDSVMQSNQNFWTGLSSQFTNISATFLSLVNPLKDWEEKSAAYEEEYEAKLAELEQTKLNTIQNYDQQIAQMKAARGSWVTDVYGFQIADIEGSADNTNSQFRSGQETWANTISIFQQAELGWFLAAKDSMNTAISSSDGEAQFQSNAIVLANQLQTQITNSETNTTNLYNAANSLVDTYQYSAAGNLMQQALVNQQNQTTWNQQGANLSQNIVDSFGRSEAYKTAELNASNRINLLAQAIYGGGAYIVDNAEINSITNQISGYAQNQTFWQDEINGSNGGFNFNGKTSLSQTKTTQFTQFQDDITLATTLQTEVVDEERDFLKQANEFFDKSERFQELSEKAKSEGKFDESSYYLTASLREKNNALGFLKKKYQTLGDEITDSVDERGLNHTRISFLNYRDSLLNKNFQTSAELTKQIQDGKNTVEGILSEGASYDQIQGMLQSAQTLNNQGEGNKERVEKLLAESQELANRDISGDLLDGLQEMIAGIQGNLPKEISSSAVTQTILAQEKELAEKQEKANELLSQMNSLVTNNNDLAALQTLLEGGGQALNIAANSAVSKYLDDYSKKLQKENEERSANLQKTLLEDLLNGESYKYLRDAGYEFRTDGDGISAYRQIYSGEIVVNGNAMAKNSYSPELEYQYMRIQTKFNPGNLSVDMLDPNRSTFSAETVSNLKRYIDDLQKNVETMFAQFSDKTQEVKGEYTQNQEIQTQQEEQYAENRDSVLSMFQGLEPNFQKTFQPTMNGLKEYHQEAAKYSFEEGAISGRGGSFQKLSREMFGGILTGNGAFTGSRELKGTVNVKGIPVEISYGSQNLIVVSGFQIENLEYNFKLNGTGTKYTSNELSNVNNKYSKYQEDIEARIAAQAKANDAEKESKGFIFTIMNGMNGG